MFKKLVVILCSKLTASDTPQGNDLFFGDKNVS